jgi:TRAP-type C4-dicarboxylate transport system permease small subunit
MRKNVKGWIEYYARLAVLLFGLVLAIGGINAMIRIMPEQRILFIIFAFIFLISWIIAAWIELRRIRKTITKGG